MPQRCFAREADALAFLNGCFTADGHETDSRHSGGSTASGPLRLRLSQLSWLSAGSYHNDHNDHNDHNTQSTQLSWTAALSDADGGAGARRPRRAAAAWLCCCCGGGGDAGDQPGGADNHEALLRDSAREEPAEASGAPRSASPVSGTAPVAREHAASERHVADELASVPTDTDGVEAAESVTATPCVHTVWGIRCPYDTRPCPWPVRQ